MLQDFLHAQYAPRLDIVIFKLRMTISELAFERMAEEDGCLSGQHHEHWAAVSPAGLCFGLGADHTAVLSTVVVSMCSCAPKNSILYPYITLCKPFISLKSYTFNTKHLSRVDLLGSIAKDVHHFGECLSMEFLLTL